MSNLVRVEFQDHSSEILTPPQRRYLIYALGVYNLNGSQFGDESDPEYQRWLQEHENPKHHAYSRVQKRLTALMQHFIEREEDPTAIATIGEFLRTLPSQQWSYKIKAAQSAKNLLDKGELTRLSNLNFGEKDLLDRPELLMMTGYSLSFNGQPGNSNHIVNTLLDQFRPEGLKEDTDGERGLFDWKGMETVIPGVFLRIRPTVDQTHLEFGIDRATLLEAVRAPLIGWPPGIDPWDGLVVESPNVAA